MSTQVFKNSLYFLLLISLTSCFSKKNKDSLLINGAGASFPYILYSKWLSEYRKLHPSVAINYQSIGSGGGIRQFMLGTLDFGGTDVPVSKEELSSSKKEVLHIPTALGAVVITYNLKLKKPAELFLSAPLLSKIFRGKIKKWDHPELQKLNPSLKLANEDIVPIYRADGSGTTSFFTKYLSLNSPVFLKELGYGKSVAWPAGVGGKGNEGVMSLVTKIEGAIAYIGASFAVSQKLSMATIKNPAGQFVKPNLESILAAATQAMKVTKSYTSPLINMKGKKSYPLSGFTYIIISKVMPEKKGKALVEFLKWALTKGQNFSENLHFIPLPNTVRKPALKKLNQVEFK